MANRALLGSLGGGTKHSPDDGTGHGFTIRSDGNWKNFKMRDEVPKKVLASEFDYQDADEVLTGFFKHKNSWYHIDQFERATGRVAAMGWDGYHGDSFFTGVVIKLSKDGEQYKVGVLIAK